jgi:nucleoside-diphosphate-sugar epimerase
MMRVLITGATGFIGRALIPALLAEPALELALLVREESSGSRRLPPPLSALREQVQLVYADLRNFQLTVRAVREVQPARVIHLAAAGVADPFLPVETAVRHNVTGTVNLLRACLERQAATEQLIVARTPGERAAMNVYAASKAAAWSFCQMYGRTAGWPIHGAMIYQTYGPGQAENLLVPAAMKAALAGQDFPMTSGVQEKDWIYLDDVVRGLLALLRHPALDPGTTVELGTGKATPLLDVVNEIYQLVGEGGRPLPGVIPDRPGEEVRQVGEVEETRALLGWEAAVSLRSGLASLLSKGGDGRWW